MIGGADWRIPIKEYIRTEELQKDKWQARKLRIICTKYCIIKESLFKRGVSDPYLLCIHGEGLDVVIREFIKDCMKIILLDDRWLSKSND